MWIKSLATASFSWIYAGKSFIEMAKYLLANDCGGSEPDKDAELFLLSERFSQDPILASKEQGGGRNENPNLLTMQLQ